MTIKIINKEKWRWPRARWGAGAQHPVFFGGARLTAARAPLVEVVLLASRAAAGALDRNAPHRSIGGATPRLWGCKPKPAEFVQLVKTGGWVGYDMQSCQLSLPDALSVNTLATSNCSSCRCGFWSKLLTRR